MRSMNRFISLLLTVAMLLSVFPASIFPVKASAEGVTETDPLPEQATSTVAETTENAVPDTTEAPETLPPVVIDPAVLPVADTEDTGEGNTAEGTCGTDLTWTLSAAGVLTISGTGKMTDYSGANAPWYTHRSAITAVVIGSGVESIGNYAFYQHSAISQPIVLPDSVHTIGSYAFYNCTALSGIVLPGNLREIGAYAFYGCKGITGPLLLPAMLTHIGNDAFHSCTGLTSVSFPESLLSLGSYAFYGCTGLTGDLLIPASVSSIGNYAFYDCRGLGGKLTIEPGAKTVGNCAFYNCTALTGLELGEGITSIGASAFYNCYSLTGELKLPASLTSLGANAFYGCKNLVGEILVPDGITILNNGVFYGMSGITSLVLGESFQKFDTHYNSPYSPLYNMTGLKTITFRGTTVPTYYSNSYHPFRNVSSLEAIYVPASAYTQYATTYRALLSENTKILSIGVDSDFQIEDGVLIAYFGDDSEVEIPEEVTAIADYAFAGNSAITKLTFAGKTETIGAHAFDKCKNLKEVVFPQELTQIGEYAFNGCTALETLTFPEKLETIGKYLCSGCTGLLEVTLPSSLEVISEYAFYNCSKLETVTFREGLKTIDKYAFRNCSSLKGIALPESLSVIGEEAFAYCTGMTGDLIIPRAVTEIGRSAFYECRGLNGKLTIEPGPKTIGSNAFYYCTGLTGLELGEGITTIGSGAFYYCYRITGDLVIPESVTTIDGSAFYNCYGFNGALILPKTLKSIGYAAFYGCKNLTGTLVLPEGLTYMGGSAFYNCTGFTGEIVVPDGITTLENGAFYNMTGITSLVFGESFKRFETYYNAPYSPLYNMTGLKTITFNSTTVPTCYSNYYHPFWNVTSLEKVFVPKEAYSDYATAWQAILPTTARLISIGMDSDFQIEEGVLVAYFGEGGEVEIPAEVTAIADNAFARNTTITKITFAGSTASIGAYAFDKCTALKEVVFPQGLTQIGAYAFNGCTSLESLTFPETLETIGNYLCNGCTGLLTVTLPSSLEVISEYAFYNCSKLETVNFSEGLKTIGNYAFQNCVALKSLSLPAGLTTIGEGAFRQCAGMTGDLVIPGSVSSIGNYAFYECRGLNGKLTIEAGPKTIGVSAFYYCIALTGLELGEGITTIGSNAFNYCYSITGDLVIPESVTTIEGAAFYNCYGFNGTLTLPKTLKSIGASAFSGCKNLTGTLTLPESLTSLGGSAFYNCTGFTGELVVPNGITTLENGAFYNMTGITSLVFGENFRKFNTYYNSPYSPINYMTGLKTITFHGTYVPTFYSTGYHPFYNVTSLETVYVPASAYTQYATTYRALLPQHATIRSLGVEGDFQIEEGVLIAYFGDDTQVEIPAEVTAIANYAFASNTTVTKITFAGSTASIGAYAFDKCTALKEVVFPEGLNQIGAYAFRGCTALESLVFPETLETIGSYLCSDCTGLLAVTLPVSLETVSEYAFYNCSKLQTVTFSEGLKTIGNYAFQSCVALKSLSLPAGLTTIGEGAFRQCTGMTGDLVIPGSVSSIGNYAFYECRGLNGKLTIEPGVKTIGTSSFYYCSALTGLELGEGITTIGTNAFYNCYSIAGDLVIPEGITAIEGAAFYNCYGFNGTLTLPRSLTKIGNSAFYGCKNLTGTLTLPEGLTTLGSSAFYNCTGFTGEIVVPNGITTLENGVFYNMTGITSLVLGESFKKFNTHYNSPYSPINNMTGLKTITFYGTSVPTFYSTGYHPFWNVPSLETIFVPMEAYDAYVTTFRPLLAETVEITSDFLSAEVPNLSVSRLYSKTVTLTWDPHISDRVIGYQILRDGVLVGDVTDCSFTQRNLTPGTAYTYTVVGYTQEKEPTGAAQITVIPAPATIVDIKTGGPLYMLDGRNVLYGYIENGHNLEAFEGQTVSVDFYRLSGESRIWIGQAVLDAQLSNTALWVYSAAWDLTGIPNGEHTVQLCVTDVDGATAVFEKTVTVDNSVPEQITGFTAATEDQTVVLNWSKAEDAAAYRVYRQVNDGTFLLLQQINDPSVLTYTDTGVREEDVYRYYVLGINAYGLEGIPSQTAAVMLSTDKEAPVVENILPTEGAVLTGQVTVSMTAKDNMEVVSVQLLCSQDAGATWSLLAQAEGAYVEAVLDTAQYTDGTFLIKGIAADAAQNESQALVRTYTIDNAGPGQVTGLTWDATNISAFLRWEASADADLSHYRVERKESDGSFILVKDVYDTLGIALYDLQPETGYIYRVVGYDSCGNRGVPSEEIVITTGTDTTKPVIAQLGPEQTVCGEQVTVTVLATDDVAVASIALEISGDWVTWQRVHTQTYTELSLGQKLEYPLSLADFAGDTVIIRAIVTDAAGNVSDTGIHALSLQYTIDREAPATPENVTVSLSAGAAQLLWQQSSETDLYAYAIYRSDAQDGAYTCLGNERKTLGYFDRSVLPGNTYYYRVAVTDLAGNTSELSAPVSIAIPDDTEAPKIESVLPEDGSVIGSKYSTLGLTVTDNLSLQSLLVEYSTDNETFVTLVDQRDIDSYGYLEDIVLPVESFAHGETLYVRITVADASGNRSEEMHLRYTVDRQAPSISPVETGYREGAVHLTWKLGAEDDLSQYRVYRKEAGEETFTQLTQGAVTEGQTQYSYADENLVSREITYIYQLEAVDIYGNTTTVELPPVHLEDRSTTVYFAPKAVIACDNAMMAGNAYVIDGSLSADDQAVVSWLFDFGDGCTSSQAKPVHTYEEVGEYTITLTVTDEQGLTNTAKRQITVQEEAVLGTVTIQVVDQRGMPVPGASVYFDMGEATQTVKTTDSTGFASCTCATGLHTVGAVVADNQWLPNQIEVMAYAGLETKAVLNLTRQPLLEAEFTSHRMTYEEIVQAGIDPTDPENRHMILVNLHIVYSGVPISGGVAINKTTGAVSGAPIRFSSLNGPGIPRPERDPLELDGTPDEPDDPTNPEDTEGPGSGDRELIPTLVGSEAGGDMSTLLLLDVPVQGSFVKEFFYVGLHMFNNAPEEYALVDNVITMIPPEGLTIPATKNGADELTVIQSIPGGTSASVVWYLRGDEPGSYTLGATYEGILSGFNEPVEATFTSSHPLRVYGLEAVQFSAEVIDTVDKDTFYFNLCMENVSDIPVYMPSIEVLDNTVHSLIQSLAPPKPKPEEGEEGESGESTESTEPAEPELEINEKYPESRLLYSMISDQYGYESRYPGEMEITLLKPGEKLTKRYAVYNVADYNYELNFKNAVSDAEELFGISFPIIATDMELYGLDDAQNKLANTNYSFIIHDFNHSYMEYYANINTPIARWQEVGYRVADTILNLNLKNLTFQDLRDYTEKVVIGLLMDEATQVAVDQNVLTKRLQQAKQIVDTFKATIKPYSDDSTMELVSDMLDNQDTYQQVCKELDKSGVEGATATIWQMCLGAGINVTLSWEKIKMPVVSKYLEDLEDYFGVLGDAVGILNGCADDWYQRQEIEKQLMYLNASYEESLVLITTLYNNALEGSAIQDQLGIMKERLEGDAFSNGILNELRAVVEAALDQGGAVEKVMETLDKADGGIRGPIYTIAKYAFNTADTIFGWSKKLDNLSLFRVYAELSYALGKSADDYLYGGVPSEEKAREQLIILKYMTKLRLVAEEAMIKHFLAEKSETDQKLLLTRINDRVGRTTLEEGQFKDLDEYLSYYYKKMLTVRDSLFSTYHMDLSRAEPPSVTVDFLNRTTKESFSPDYEYSYDSTQWQTCSDQPIELFPGHVETQLYVRKKAPENGLPGNVKAVPVPAMPYLSGHISVCYIEGVYRVTGLENGTYAYQFSNDKEEFTMLDTFTVSGDEPVILEAGIGWQYLGLIAAPGEDHFISRIRYVVVETLEKTWKVDNREQLLWNLTEGISTQDIEDYYTSLEYSRAQVFDPEGEFTELVGTGYKLLMGMETYVLVVTGDVNGDTAVDLFDIYDMLDHFNSEQTLEGAYLKAACVCQNEDMDIFDIYSALDYINTGEFTQ